MSKQRLYGPDLIAWVLGAADRENVSEIPQSYVLPRVDGDVVLTELSPAMRKLTLSAIAFDGIIARQHEEAKGDDEAHAAYHSAFEHVGRPVHEALNLLSKAQLRTDMLEAGVDIDKYVASGVADGNVIVGYPDDTTYQIAVLTHRQRNAKQAQTE